MTQGGDEKVCKLVQSLFLGACDIVSAFVCTLFIVCMLSISESVLMWVHVLVHHPTSPKYSPPLP